MRKGVPCHEQIVEELLSGMEMDPAAKILLVDCMPNRFLTLQTFYLMFNSIKLLRLCSLWLVFARLWVATTCIVCIKH